MYTIGHVKQLECGHTGPFAGFTSGLSSSLQPDTIEWIEAEVGWHILRDQILRDWILKKCMYGHGGPGSRPWAWWHIDKRERRRRIDGKPHPFDNPEREAHCDRCGIPDDRQFLEKLYYGVPGHLIVPDDFEAEYESEAEYIERLNLWLPGEIEAGIPVLTAEIAAMRRDFANAAHQEPTTQALDVLRRAEAMLKRLTKLSATA